MRISVIIIPGTVAVPTGVIVMAVFHAILYTLGFSTGNLQQDQEEEEEETETEIGNQMQLRERLKKGKSSPQAKCHKISLFNYFDFQKHVSFM